MEQGWEGILQFIYLFVLLGVALVLKNSFKLFRKHLVPLSILAGLMGLLLGPEVLGWIHFDKDLLTKAVYHALALGFIALGLKERRSKRSEDIINTGLFTVNTYAVQGIVGLAVSLLLARFFYPDLFKSMGMLLPLSFGQGPGQAVSIGRQWEDYGFTNGASVGLSVATIGFLWALIAGVPLMNVLVRRQKKQRMRDIRPDLDTVTQVTPDDEERTAKIPKSIYIDELAIQLVLIGVVYALTYGFMYVLSDLLAPLGEFGQTLSSLLWGFNFLWGAIIAMTARILLNKLCKRNIIKKNYTDNFLLQRISSTLFDFMIAASITAVSISVLIDYLVPVIVLTTVGGVFMIFYIVAMCKWIYKKDLLENILVTFGTWTGTITTGMALLKEVDPNSKSNAPENIVIGSGIAAGAGVVLMMILSLLTMAESTGNSLYYLWTFLSLIAYSAAMLLGIVLVKRAYRKRNEKQQSE